MPDPELSQRIAEGITPWTVGEIKVESHDQQYEVQVECNDMVVKQCPHCDHTQNDCELGEEQIWRQPDAGSWQVFLKGRLPLVQCPEHGLVSVSPPWADWYIRGLNQSLLGPWSLQQVKLLLDAGRITPSTLLKRSSTRKWVITGTISALFVKQEEPLEPPLTVHELAAVDWAIANAPVISESLEATMSVSIPTDSHKLEEETFSLSHTDMGDDGLEKPQRVDQTSLLSLTGVTPARKEAKPKEPENELFLRLLDDSDGDDNRAPPPSIKPPPVSKPSSAPKPFSKPSPRVKASREPAIPEAEELPATDEPEELPPKRKKPGLPKRTRSLKQPREKKRKAKVVRKQPVDDEFQLRGTETSRHKALVRKRGFQNGYQLLTLAYLINSCLVGVLVPAVCTIFFSRLLLLSTSVFAPFEGGNTLQEGQLVACGLAALSLLVLIGFPIWHLISNESVIWHYVPSALLGMTVGFGLPPGYIDEVFVVLQCCEVVFGIATVGLAVFTLSMVPAQSRMSVPLIVAGLVTALCAVTLCGVRSASMLTIQADIVPPQIRGALPAAPMYVFGLYGSLVFIPAAILIELYPYSNYASRQFIIRNGALFGMYVVAGLATLGAFVNGAKAGFFDVPIALLPLVCGNALAAAIPSALLMVDPQYSVSQD